MLQALFSFNRKICRKIEKYLPQAQPNFLRLYEQTIAQYLNRKTNQIVIDVGGGNSCPFNQYRNPKLGNKIIAVDISREALDQNHDVDQKITADITKSLPFADNSVDLLTSRWLLEHLKNPKSFIADSYRVLQPNGRLVYLFSCRFAPFALINRFLPAKMVKQLLYFLNPEINSLVGFPSYYQDCFYSGIRRILEKEGFKVVSLQVNYYQSQYYDFCLPLFLLSSLYENIIRLFNLKNLAAHVLIIAEKRPKPAKTTTSPRQKKEN